MKNQSEEKKARTAVSEGTPQAQAQTTSVVLYAAADGVFSHYHNSFRDTYLVVHAGPVSVPPGKIGIIAQDVGVLPFLLMRHIIANSETDLVLMYATVSTNAAYFAPKKGDCLGTLYFVNL